MPADGVKVSALMPVQDALNIILGDAQRRVTPERVDLARADGRVLLEDVPAPMHVPPWDNSAMDGYAVQTQAAVQGATLEVSQRIPAGVEPKALQPATAARIFTGAPLPAGADSVIMQENCEVLADGQVRILHAAEPGANIRRRGDDITQGELLASAGQRLTPLDLGLLAAAGVSELLISKPPVVALLSTGDELVQPGEQLRPGQIFSSNAIVLRALLHRMGLHVVDLGTIADRRDETTRMLLDAAQQADCIITTGGVSAGEEDHVRAVVQDQGRLDIWKLALKPGKPFAYGRVDDALFFGLPGNPVSAFVSFALLVRPALLRLMGITETGLPWQLRPAGFDVTTAEREEYLRVCVMPGDEQRVVPFRNQGSGVSSSLSRAHGLAVIAPHTTVRQGDMLRFVAFDDIF